MMMMMTINIVSLYLIKYDNDCESLLCVGGDATPRPHRYTPNSLHRGAAVAALLGVAVVALRGGGAPARLGAGAAIEAQRPLPQWQGARIRICEVLLYRCPDGPVMIVVDVDPIPVKSPELTFGKSRGRGSRDHTLSSIA